MKESPLRDGDIRRPLHLWLEEQHDGCLETGIIHELRIPRPSARADLAVVNGEMVGYEIKSDVDSLARLPKQVRAFDRVFDKSIIVTTERHMRHIEKETPYWWGIITPIPDSGFHVIRKAQRNPTPNLESALFILRRIEILAILDFHGLANGMRSKRHADLVIHAVSSINSDRLRADLRHALRGRLLRTPA